MNTPMNQHSVKVREELSTTAAEESWSSAEESWSLEEVTASVEVATREAVNGETQGAHTEAEVAAAEEAAREAATATERELTLPISFSCAECCRLVVVTEHMVFDRFLEVATKAATGIARRRSWLSKWFPAPLHGQPFDLRVSCTHCRHQYNLRMATCEWESEWDAEAYAVACAVASSHRSFGTAHKSYTKLQ